MPRIGQCWIVNLSTYISFSCIHTYVHVLVDRVREHYFYSFANLSHVKHACSCISRCKEMKMRACCNHSEVKIFMYFTCTSYIVHVACRSKDLEKATNPGLFDVCCILYIYIGHVGLETCQIIF